MSELPKLLTPDLAVERPPPASEAARYVRSYLLMRLFIGALGVTLPFILGFGDGFGFGDDPAPRDALSDYYYSGLREVFVGTLSAIGVFLITYRLAEITLDNTLSIIAGGAALAVALFPTGPPPGAELTPLQGWLTEGTVSDIHYGAAIVFIFALGGICVLFGVEEGRRTPQTGARSPGFWRLYHWGCAAAIAAALAWMGVSKCLGGPSDALFWGESASVLAFGASWFMKGYEWDYLRGRPPATAPHSVHPPDGN